MYSKRIYEQTKKIANNTERTFVRNVIIIFPFFVLCAIQNAFASYLEDIDKISLYSDSNVSLGIFIYITFFPLLGVFLLFSEIKKHAVKHEIGLVYIFSFFVILIISLLKLILFKYEIYFVNNFYLYMSYFLFSFILSVFAVHNMNLKVSDKLEEILVAISLLGIVFLLFEIHVRFSNEYFNIVYNDYYVFLILAFLLYFLFYQLKFFINTRSDIEMLNDNKIKYKNIFNQIKLIKKENHNLSLITLCFGFLFILLLVAIFYGYDKLFFNYFFEIIINNEIIALIIIFYMVFFACLRVKLVNRYLLRFSKSNGEQFVKISFIYAMIVFSFSFIVSDKVKNSILSLSNIVVYDVSVLRSDLEKRKDLEFKSEWFTISKNVEQLVKYKLKYYKKEDVRITDNSFQIKFGIAYDYNDILILCPDFSTDNAAIGQFIAGYFPEYSSDNTKEKSEYSKIILKSLVNNLCIQINSKDAIPIGDIGPDL